MCYLRIGYFCYCPIHIVTSVPLILSSVNVLQHKHALHTVCLYKYQILDNSYEVYINTYNAHWAMSRITRCIMTAYMIGGKLKDIILSIFSSILRVIN